MKSHLMELVALVFAASIKTNRIFRQIKQKSWQPAEHRKNLRMIHILGSAPFSEICGYLSAITHQRTFQALSHHKWQTDRAAATQGTI